MSEAQKRESNTAEYSSHAIEIRVHKVTNLDTDCSCYVKAKLGFEHKQKTSLHSPKKGEIIFDEPVFFYRWIVTDKAEVGLWKRTTGGVKHKEVGSVKLKKPMDRSGTYRDIFTLIRVEKEKAKDGSEKEIEVQAGKIDLTVTCIAQHKRWNMLTEEQKSEDPRTSGIEDLRKAVEADAQPVAALAAFAEEGDGDERCSQRGVRGDSIMAYRKQQMMAMQEAVGRKLLEEEEEEEAEAEAAVKKAAPKSDEYMLAQYKKERQAPSGIKEEPEEKPEGVAPAEA